MKGVELKKMIQELNLYNKTPGESALCSQQGFPDPYKSVWIFF